jgi:predicted transcriptional regulator
MSTLTITLPDERMTELQHIASRLGSSPEKLVEESIQELLKQAEPDVHRAITYVLKKNQELYKRLA